MTKRIKRRKAVYGYLFPDGNMGIYGLRSNLLRGSIIIAEADWLDKHVDFKVGDLVYDVDWDHTDPFVVKAGPWVVTRTYPWNGRFSHGPARGNRIRLRRATSGEVAVHSVLTG